VEAAVRRGRLVRLVRYDPASKATGGFSIGGPYYLVPTGNDWWRRRSKGGRRKRARCRRRARGRGAET
jgi:hypothetical protein